MAKKKKVRKLVLSKINFMLINYKKFKMLIKNWFKMN